MILAHKIRLNPTTEQPQHFRQCLGVARFTWNWALAEWDRRYAADEKPSVQKLKLQLNAIKGEQFPWMYTVSKSVVEYALINLGKAFDNFFRGAKKGDAVGYPKFKSKRNPVQSFTVANDRIKIEGHHLSIQKCPSVINMAETLRFAGKVNAVTISLVADHWYASISVEIGNVEVEPSGSAVGVDLGVKDLAVTSDGGVFENQKALRSHLDKLAKLQRYLARKVKGSMRWRKLKLQVARLHERIANIRQDAIHKLTTYLCQRYSYIAIEDLHVAGMLKNRQLARAIAACGWAEIRRQLEYKGKRYGALIVAIDRWFPSSKTHAQCGYVNQELTLADRVWLCPICNDLVLRDANAAQNILAYSLTRAYLCPSW
jgi:putative transposase